MFGESSCCYRKQSKAARIWALGWHPIIPSRRIKNKYTTWSWLCQICSKEKPFIGPGLMELLMIRKIANTNQFDWPIYQDYFVCHSGIDRWFHYRHSEEGTRVIGVGLGTAPPPNFVFHMSQNYWMSGRYGHSRAGEQWLNKSCC